MGIFAKKGPCAVCGGKVSGLFPWKIDGNYVCDSCHGFIDVPDNMDNNFSFDEFLRYREFRDENQLLKNRFTVTDTVDMGLLDTKIVFDRVNKMFCFSKRLDKTIFTGDQLVSFVVSEDSEPLYECSAEGLVRHNSKVPERVRAMAPTIQQVRQQQMMNETIDRLANKDDNARPARYTVDVPEPFKRFNVELRFDHPYWKVIHCDMNGPTFNMSYPDADDYMREYRQCIEKMQVLASALTDIAFPGALERAQASAANAKTDGDAVAEIKKYKALMDEGVISPADFEAKKKQLLGI